MTGSSKFEFDSEEELASVEAIQYVDTVGGCGAAISSYTSSVTEGKRGKAFLIASELGPVKSASYSK